VSPTSPQQVGNFPVYGKVRGNVSNGCWALLRVPFSLTLLAAAAAAAVYDDDDDVTF